MKRAIERVPLSQKDNLLCKKSERETLQKGSVPSSVQKRIENEKVPSVVPNASITMFLVGSAEASLSIIECSMSEFAKVLRMRSFEPIIASDSKHQSLLTGLPTETQGVITYN